MLAKNVNNQSPLVVTQIPRKKQFYKTKMCPWFFSGRCDRGIDCLFAHSQEELNPIPDLSFTSLCPLAKKSGLCKNEKCSYAHSVCELRPTGDLYKTAPCTKFLRGKCNAESHCRHAHYIEELRPLPGNISPSQNAINLMLAAPLATSMQKISKSKNNFYMDENRGNINNSGGAAVVKKNDKELKNYSSMPCSNYSMQNNLNNTRFGKKYMKNASADNSMLLGTNNMDTNSSNSNNNVHNHVTSNMGNNMNNNNNNNELDIHNNINENILNNIMSTTATATTTNTNNMNKSYRKSFSYSNKLYALLKSKDNNKDGNNMNLKFKSFLMNNHDMNNTNNTNLSNNNSGILNNFSIRKIHSAPNKNSDDNNAGYKSINEMVGQDINMNCSINSNHRGTAGNLIKKGGSMSNNNSMVKAGNGNIGGSNMTIGINTKMNSNISNVSMGSGHSNITNQHYGINRGPKNDGLHYSSFSTKEPSSPMRMPSNSSKEYAEANETNLVDTIEHMEITAQDSVLKVIEDDNEKFNTSDIKNFFKLLQMTNVNNYNDDNFLYNDADMNEDVNNNMYDQYKSASIPADIMKQQMSPDLSLTPEQYTQNNNIKKYDINENFKNIYKLNNSNLASCSNFWNFPEDEFPAPASKIAQDVEIFDY
ncbi:zinc finger protein, putative [Plasmodium berghei]|uniref:Zinc finger protein, putative n=2 Tax=Plasmodium berghei TaxID=5821 RepID=A0A509ANS0_PLABA|nr:zinc finger protein, putative [Plasmodium berghei ANKA]CXI82842.1 zinc finger protein, putative [Plasmodium berghei]SCM25658.1 zinc finger protein, putative [Plasmodium berghei]SCN27440.1 zinc finger protein, putative [Plasmodium berghei]SCO62136.1 zinc finger protein, putative [Plasmodium berghei]SCO63867.1 zinc finger protein, putative [Plasmodium berghei]|eukprot:XP_034423072.1 zinc finger protein, putative [Plasmodium berghei ANKA]